jgi:Transposase and inactivated derivatives
MEPRHPEEIWVSDITYIGSGNTHMYLSLVTDAYSKKIMGFDLSDSLNTQGAINALKMANKGRKHPLYPLIHHSDRGIQYCSDIYQRLLNKYHITTSMTESYDPYANAIAERVNGILKQEFLLEDLNLPLAEMKKVIKDVVNTYNTMRPHYSCAYNTPEFMHCQHNIRIKNYKSRTALQG